MSDDRRTTDWGSASEVAISQCVYCKHWRKKSVCVAYPQGVPLEILSNEHDHRQPFAGDGGVRFEPRTETQLVPRF